MNVHFTLGENFGKILSQIAIEKLYDFDIPGALRTFSESLGCSDKISLELLLGNYILIVEDQDKCLCSAIPKEEIEVDDYPKIYFPGLQRKLLELFQDQRDLEYETVFENFQFKIREIEEKLYLNQKIEFEGSYLDLLPINGIALSGEFEIEYRQLISLILSDQKDAIEFLNDSRSRNHYIYEDACYIIDKVKEITIKRDGIIQTAEFIETYWPDHKYGLKRKIENYIDRINDFLNFVNNALQDRVEMLDEPVNILEKHINAALEIDKVLKNFGPSKITDKYKAGWLAPDGTFFGLNGEVSNYLHITLADAIFKYYEWPDPENQSKDYALDLRGFVKIQESRILFSGYDFSLLQMSSRKLTKRQIDKICEYGRACYNGKLLFGFKEAPISVDEFENYNDEELEKLF